MPAQETLQQINYLTQAQYDTALANNQINEDELYLTPSTTLATVATTGSYNDLSSKPSIPSIFTTSKTLQVANWSNNSQTVSISAVAISSTVIVSPIPTSIDDYTAAGIRCSSQASGTLTFTCTTTPSNIVYINVIIIN